MSPYHETIKRVAPTYDPRLIECWMRLEHGTLDHLSPDRFAAEVRIACECADHAGENGNRELLSSYGYGPYFPTWDDVREDKLRESCR